MTGASLADTVLLVQMHGSLAEGDLLLKHYGGVCYALLDSIAAGWPVVELRIGIDDVVLVLRRRYLLEAIDQIVSGAPDEETGLWILEHTLLEDLP